jgi:acyl carrier protein
MRYHAGVQGIEMGLRMTEAEIYEQLTQIFHDVFDDDTIVLRAETTASDVAGWDSMKMVLLIIAVEQHFAIKLRTRDMDALKCVGDFVGIIASKAMD